jgi:CBS domain-containing membrane protein
LVSLAIHRRGESAFGMAIAPDIPTAGEDSNLVPACGRNTKEASMTTQQALVGDVMTKLVTTIEHNEMLAQAEEAMRSKRIRHMLAVDDDGLLQGVLSQRDVFHGGLLKALGYGTRARQQALESLRVKDAMTAAPITTTPATPLREAAMLMVERKIGCLPVLDGERLVGILTESDFLLLFAHQA